MGHSIDGRALVSPVERTAANKPTNLTNFTRDSSTLVEPLTRIAFRAQRDAAGEPIRLIGVIGPC
jgi:hypothetical protein